jgi:hypothetical protein
MSVVDIELAHEVDETPYPRRLAALVGVVAVVAALLGVLQMHANTQEGRSQARSSRLTAEIARGLEVQGLVFAFQGPTIQIVLSEGIAANSRALAALQAGEGAAVAGAAAEVEGETITRLSGIIDEMSAPPGQESGLDPVTLETLRRDLDALSALADEQNREVDRAERFGLMGDRAVLALTIVALAAVLLGLAGVVGAGRGGTMILASAVVAIALSIGAGAWALLS